MAKKSMLAREKKRAVLRRRHADKRALLKKNSVDSNLSPEERMGAILKLQSMPRNGSAVRGQRRCNVCGRPRSVYRKFGVCRICLRNMLMRGEIPGARKASW